MILSAHQCAGRVTRPIAVPRALLFFKIAPRFHNLKVLLEAEIELAKTCGDVTT